jgi:hypothetical protein
LETVKEQGKVYSTLMSLSPGEAAMDLWELLKPLGVLLITYVLLFRNAYEADSRAGWWGGWLKEPRGIRHRLHTLRLPTHYRLRRSGFPRQKKDG